MGSPGLFPVILALALAAPAGAGRPPASGGQHSHSHEGVPENLPEHPAVGETAPEFTLKDLNGRPLSLGEFLGRGYVIVLFGSASSSDFRKRAPEVDRLASRWERLEVKVLVVYTREAHPAALRKKAPRNFRERLALARQTRKDLKLGVPFVVDEWDDPVLGAYGRMPAAAFLLDSRGTIAVRQVRANPSVLEKALCRLLKLPEPPAGP